MGTTYSSERLAEIYIREIVLLHGEPVSIILDWGTQFTSQFWISFARCSLDKSVMPVERFVMLLFMVREKVLLKDSPMKGVIRFEKKVKLSPLYIGSFEVLQRTGEVAYKFALPPSLSSVHPVFHVSMLQKHIGNSSHILDFNMVQLDGDLTYDVELVAILDWQVRMLRSKNIVLVKVQWIGQPAEEANWETEREIRRRYPHLFETPFTFLDMFEDERLFKRGRM
ncbi:uncharacterized protein [Nicotiana tomentosiformis]|uniref:uncharacterized protein n=1 Tax=Nicotiana tomentosiformis TaxID=4098 RepID=UPI00388C68BB